MFTIYDYQKDTTEGEFDTKEEAQQEIDRQHKQAHEDNEECVNWLKYPIEINK